MNCKGVNFHALMRTQLYFSRTFLYPNFNVLFAHVLAITAYFTTHSRMNQFLMMSYVGEILMRRYNRDETKITIAISIH